MGTIKKIIDGVQRCGYDAFVNDNEEFVMIKDGFSPTIFSGGY